MRLTLLVTSPRVAAGLLSWSAWQAVAGAGRVVTSDAGTPLARAVAGAGHRVEVVPEVSLRALSGVAADAVVVLLTDEETDRLPGEVAAAVVAGGPDLPEVEVLHASHDVPGARLLDLVTVMDRLRTDCPWDREQTHRSLARHLLEETYEALEAIETGDPVHLQEELGDVLLQVLFHARIAEEDVEDGFTIDDVAGGIVDKLVRRHPHVFAGLEVADADTVNRNWDALKAQEKGRTSPLEGVPQALPALALADTVLRRLGAAAGSVAAGPEAPVGERLLALVAEARAAGIDPEQALRDAVRAVASRSGGAPLG